MENKNEFKRLSIIEGMACGAVVGLGIGILFLGNLFFVAISTAFFGFCGIFLSFVNIEWLYNLIKTLEGKRVG